MKKQNKIIAAVSFCILLSVVLLAVFSHSSDESIEVKVRNTSDNLRQEEIVELSFPLIQEKLNLEEGETFIVCEAEGKQIPYQVTYDGKVIFQVDIEGESEARYTVEKGNPDEFQVISTGRFHAERNDDFAWENDKVGFRAYGPYTQNQGARMFGYDLFTKRGTSVPVLEEMYAMETEMVVVDKIEQLRKTDPERAAELRRLKSYHSDRGHGMDCYAVGPTLGAGAAALLENGDIVFPWCFKDYDVLDNGPLRFTFKLVFHPFMFQGKEIVETRIISIDAGSHMNKTQVIYAGLEHESPVVSGIVLHGEDCPMEYDKEKGFIAYQDPTTGTDNGEIYVGHAFDHSLKDAGIGQGHLLAYDTYRPGTGFIYWWGFGWNRSDISSFEDWEDYVEDFAENLRKPLEININ